MKNFLNFINNNHEYSNNEMNKIIKFIGKLCKYENKKANAIFNFNISKNILNDTDFNASVRSNNIYSNDIKQVTKILDKVCEKLNMYPTINIMINTFGRSTNYNINCTFEFTEKNKLDILATIEGNKLGLL